MAKSKNLFCFVKKIFTADPKTKQEKKEKRNRWLFGKLKPKMAPPALMNSTLAKAKYLLEAEEQQSKHALAVAVATAAAAEAAVAAAKAAAEVVRITGTPLSYRHHREFAAIRIQTSFRGYLARRALRALKALVKLQALVRGRAVRRQTSIALKNLQSLIKIQSEARENRVRMSSQSCEANDRWCRKLKEMNLKDEGKKWDGSPLSKEEIKDICANRQEAAMKRERALEYASTRQGKRNIRRHSWMITGKELEPVNLNSRWSWLETQPWNKLDIHGVTSPARFNVNKPQQQSVAEEDGLMRRSFNRSRRNYIRDDDSLTSFSSPRRNYMAVTESSRARSQSITISSRDRH